MVSWDLTSSLNASDLPNPGADCAGLTRGSGASAAAGALSTVPDRARAEAGATGAAMRASAGSRGGAGVREEAVTGTLDEETARAAGLELTEPDPLVASGARLRIAATGIGAGAGKSAVCVTTTGAEAGDGAVAGLPARAAGRITTEAPRPVGTMFTAAASRACLDWCRC